MKVFTLTFGVLLLVATSTQAAKVRRSEKPVKAEKTNTSATEQALKTDINEAETDSKKEKEVHKRGILHHHGAALAGGGGGSLWPKTYASYYGYGLHLPAASSLAAHHLQPAPVLKYHGHGFHYKALAAPAVVPAVGGFGAAALPNYASFSPAISHAHPIANSQPFIIRPGGAVVQSYSITYPHRKPAFAVKPVHGFGALSPAHHVSAVAAVQPPIAAVHPVHSFQTVQHAQPVRPEIPLVAAVQPVAAIQPVQHFNPVQQLPPVAPPVQTVVQTSFLPPALAPVPSLPQGPSVAFSTGATAFPAIPTFPDPPAIPSIPSIPSIPNIPAIPDVPAVPAVPSIPTIPSIPNFPQPQIPANSFFPISVQPPLNQKPPVFASVHPQGQFPGFGPIAGGSNPDFGAADASPQIPVQPLATPEPVLPLPAAESTQTPWKPVLYEPPTVESSAGRPSHTLLPPYNSSPAQGYLPPAPISHSGRNQQEYNIDNSLFDNLSDADIQEIFAQASLAAHRDHHHHAVHNYHTRY